MSEIPPFPGPHLVALLDGRLVFNDSEDYRHECEARDIASYPLDQRNEWLQVVEKFRGPDAAARLRKTIDEVIAVTAAKSR